jgi:ABC-2 type transport system permease protein
MLTNVFTKTVRDRWMAMVIAAAILAGFLLYAMSVYQDIDPSLYTDLPKEVRELMGISDSLDASGLAYGAVYSFMGALTLAGVAIAMGSSAIAGEERNGTIGLLLANPKSRTHVLLSKAASLALVTGAGALILWAGGRVVPMLLDVDVGGFDVGALALHMWANALFYGFLALMLGAWTGNGSGASGITAAVMGVSYLAAGMLPLVEGLSDAARLFPWYYYDSGDPLFNGVEWGHLGLLLGASTAFVVLAVMGVNGRDLTEQAGGENLTDRLRRHPLTQRVVERLEGSARVSRISVKTSSEHQGLLIVTGLVVLLFGVMVGPLFAVMDEGLKEVADQLPEALMALVGDADMGTAEGFYQTENFSLTLPIAFILVTSVIGARALAGEEQRRTMGLLLANPIRRSLVVTEKAVAMVAYAIVLGTLTFFGTMAGSLLGGLGMSAINVAATSVLLTLIGLVFGGVALALSAATGQTRFASYGAAGLSLGLFLLNSFLPLSEGLAGYARLSPFHYYLGSDPLVNGMQWGHAGLLAALTAVLIAASVVLFERRDLRQG